MANYADIIERAIERMADHTPEKRALIYKKARSALSKQLDALDPPASDAEKQEQLSALDVSIDAIELKYAKAVHVEDFDDERDDADLSDAVSSENDAEPESHDDDDADDNDSAQTHSHEDTAGGDESDGADLEDDADLEDEQESETNSTADDEDTPASDEVSGDQAEPAQTTSQKPRPEPSIATSAFPKAADGPDPRLAPEATPFSPSADLVTSSTFEPETRGRFGRKRNTVLTRVLSYGILSLALGGALWGVGYLGKTYLLPLFQTIKDERPLQIDVNPLEKIPERLSEQDQGADRPGQNAEQPAVAQSAFLYNEDPDNPKAGNVFKATVTWRVEEQSRAAEDGGSEPFIRGLIEVPEKALKLMLSIKRNTDPTLPASHTVEMLFDLPDTFDNGGIANVPGLIMKKGERERGQPLIGASARITNGFFIVGLSSVSLDRNRNLLLLREQNWMEIPILYDNDRRGILVLEKGVPGARIFKQVLDQWAALEAESGQAADTPSDERDAADTPQSPDADTNVPQETTE